METNRQDFKRLTIVLNDPPMSLEVNKIIQGNCLEVLKTLPENSVDSIVCDPPYGISFMGKKWDYDVPKVELWKEVLRVLKPGGHALVACGTRTQHRMAVNLEDAGFEIRDIVAWVYGSGFPKSRNIGLDVDKRNGITKNRGKAFVVAGQSGQRDKDTGGDLVPGSNTMGAYKAQNEWSGWGTALKPSMELWTLARKPLSEKTVAENVLKYGTGGINIDGCRVGTTTEIHSNGKRSMYGGNSLLESKTHNDKTEVKDYGRFPANLIHDGSDEVVKLFPNTKPSLKSQRGNINLGQFGGLGNEEANKNGSSTERGHDDNGGSASRFFYCAKASKNERNKGLEEFEQKITDDGRNKSIDNAFLLGETQRQNFHPTVKPISLMRYLCKLITPPKGIILDPFAGSGSTLIGAKLEGFNFIGIEREENYCKIAEARIKAWHKDNTLF